MLKRISFLLMLVISTAIFSSQPIPGSPPKIIIVWDLHSVLFHRTFPWRQHNVKPIDGTFDIVQELAKKGIEQHILSNIEAKSFKKILNQYPQLALIFDLKKSQVKTNKLEKPKRDFYRRYLIKNGIDPTKAMVIFIDDKKENVRGAQRLGIIGIKFNKPEQLRKDLSRMGIL